MSSCSLRTTSVLTSQQDARWIKPFAGWGEQTTASSCLCKLEDCTLPASDAVLHRGCSLEQGTELGGDPLCSQQLAQPATVALSWAGGQNPHCGISQGPQKPRGWSVLCSEPQPQGGVQPAAHSPASTSTRTFLRVSASLPWRLWHW